MIRLNLVGGEVKTCWRAEWRLWVRSEDIVMGERVSEAPEERSKQHQEGKRNDKGKPIVKPVHDGNIKELRTLVRNRCL